jgi:hypothetical protein
LNPDPTGLEAIRAASLAEFARLKPGRMTPALLQWYDAWLTEVELEVQAILGEPDEHP